MEMMELHNKNTPNNKRNKKERTSRLVFVVALKRAVLKFEWLLKEPF